MTDKRVLVTSSGVYAVKDGVTLPLTVGDEVELEAAQADNLAGRGKVEFIINVPPKPKPKPKKPRR